MWSGALLRGDGGKRGPVLLDVLAEGIRYARMIFHRFPQFDGHTHSFSTGLVVIPLASLTIERHK